MNLLEWILGLVGGGLLLGTLAGLVVRQRWRIWYGFTAYVAVVAVTTLVFLAWPSLHTPALYLAQEVVSSLLRVWMALELGSRTFRAFPGAMATLRRVVLVLTILILVVVVSLPPPATYQDFMQETLVRLINGTIWIFTTVAALILYYRLPIGWFPKSVLLSYVPYLLWYAIYLNQLLPAAWGGSVVRYLGPVVYDVMAAYWVWLAWRVAEPAPSEPKDPFDATHQAARRLVGMET